MKCPICSTSSAKFHRVDGIDFFNCSGCDFIFADPGFLRLNDEGGASREYTEDYWRDELSSAKERSFGPGLARFAEAALYCRIPIKKTLDIGTGPGYLLQALQHQLPSSSAKFYGVEKFPPRETVQSQLRNPQNYVVGMAGDLQDKFQMGTCIEVIEHLTPTMVAGLAKELRKISEPGSLYIFNTGLTQFVCGGNLGYLDPKVRGHIVSWSVRSLNLIFGPEGFKVHPLVGKTWACVLEYQGSDEPMLNRIWSPPAENKAMLDDPLTNALMYILGIDTARVIDPGSAVAGLIRTQIAQVFFKLRRYWA